MKIKLLSDRVVDGKTQKKGASIEATDITARYLIATGKAEEAKPSTKKAEK